jgi:MFS family permease
MASTLGVLADRFGRRWVIIPSLLLYTLTGYACALFPRFEILLGFDEFERYIDR